MDLDPQVVKYSNSDPLSFAYPSVRDRWPTILTQIIDDASRTIHELPSEHNDRVSEGKQIISSVAALKYEMQHNRQLVPLENDGLDDIEGYNEELQVRTDADAEGGKGNTPAWHDVEWLFSECYMYRRVYGVFARSHYWKKYDYFSRQKISSFRSSRSAVVELCSKYREIISNIQQGKGLVGDTSDADKVTEAERVLFVEMAEICLWGNATDLSLLTTITFEDIQRLQGSSARKESEKKILVNDLSSAFKILDSCKKEGKSTRRVDFVLDNAGFELFVDLILAGYLLATGLATEVVLHPKNIPWFVSDVVPDDVAALLSAMQDPKAFYSVKTDERIPSPLSEQEEADIKFVFEDWSERHGDGQITIRPNSFWTHGGSFWRMPKVAPELFTDLQESELVIFKGDLNYRKLIGDAAWDPTTSIMEAIGPLGKGSGLRVLALRTCKGDTVVGLPAGKDEELREQQGGDKEARKWAWNGKWAVIELSDGK